MIQKLESAYDSDDIMTYNSAFYYHTLLLPPCGQRFEGRTRNSFMQNVMHDVLERIGQQCWKKLSYPSISQRKKYNLKKNIENLSPASCLMILQTSRMLRPSTFTSPTSSFSNTSDLANTCTCGTFEILIGKLLRPR